MKKKIRVAIVDDDYIYRQVLIAYLKQNKTFDIIFDCSNGKEFIEALLKHKPDIVLLDIEMSIMDGIETTAYLFKHYPEIKILIHTMHNEDGLSHDLIAKGAHGFLLKEKGFQEVTEAIHVMKKHGYYFEGWNLQKIITAKNGNKNEAPPTGINFTKRELEIIRLICKENTNQEIADKLFISKRTVDGHRDNILQKTKVRNVAGLVKFALHHGLITLNE
ncbi:MAG TPA: response regulator transcription factor [Bacteroidia bacterium]|nr:response regulator transcription factor [Bacteroidia bacterium]